LGEATYEPMHIFFNPFTAIGDYSRHRKTCSQSSDAAFKRRYL